MFKSIFVKILFFLFFQFLNFWNKQDILELESFLLIFILVCSQKVVVIILLYWDKIFLYQKYVVFVILDQKYFMDNIFYMLILFKNVLEKYGFLKFLLQILYLEEDLKEVLCFEVGIEFIIEDDIRFEKQKRKFGLWWSFIKKVWKFLVFDIVDEDVKLMMFILFKFLFLLIIVFLNFFSFILLGIKEDNSLFNQGFLQVKFEKVVVVQKF